ncbi:MAG TPA: phasin family protein, partial [Methylocella sp.]|nr:phasin family protein [Methylocella sp.]
LVPARASAQTLKEDHMAYEFEDIQKYSKEQFDAAAAATTSFAKTLQAIAAETGDYSKKAFENSTAFVEKLLGAKSYDSAIQIHSEYWKNSYAGFIAQATKLGELYSNLAKEAFKPIETALSKVQGSKN